MADFIQLLFEPEVPVMRYALLAGLLASIPLGIVGTFVVVRRISYLAAAIAHAVLAGVGAALYCQGALGMDWMSPLYGAVVAALCAAFIIGWVHLRAQEREDTVIGAIWSIGMAIGLIFIYKTPGYVDPMGYLFGDILILSPADLWLAGVLSMGVLVLTGLYYKNLLAVCYDAEFAELRGVSVQKYYFLLLALTALTVVLLISVVGIVLVIALLTLPPAISGQYARRLWQMMVGAVILIAFFSTSGLAISYFWELPTGATIIAITGFTYLAVSCCKK